jgi:hypothetical protein
MLNERRKTTVGRLVSGLIVVAALVFAGAASAQKTYYVSGGGAQLAIGGGLPLPIQTVPQTNTTMGGTVWNGNNFPPLLIKPNNDPNNMPTLIGTTAMTSNQALQIPAGILTRAAEPSVVGVFQQNPSLYAVATDLGYSWPASAVTLNSTNRTGANTTTFTAGLGLSPPSVIAYQAPPSGKFGGPARFKITPGPSQGAIPGSPVTVYAIAVPPTGNPPCTHPAFGGANPACVAALIVANPNTLAQVGAPVGSTGATVPTPPVPGIVVGAFDAAGNRIVTAYTPSSNPGLTNMATSAGFPFTVGKLVIQAGAALGQPETFTITGADNRTAGGAGTIQLVAASLSDRVLSGPNANRGWVQLDLITDLAVPTMGEWARVATIVLMAALTVGFFVVRRSNEATE